MWCGLDVFYIFVVIGWIGCFDLNNVWYGCRIL